jgi:hypothetical protein
MALCLAVISFGSRIRFNSSSTVCRFPDSTASNHFSSSSSLSFFFRRELSPLDEVKDGLDEASSWAFCCLPKLIFSLMGGLFTRGLGTEGNDVSAELKTGLISEFFADFLADSFVGLGGGSLSGFADSFFLLLFAGAGFFVFVWTFPGFPEHFGQKYGTSSLLTHSSLCVTPTHSK